MNQLNSKRQATLAKLSLFLVKGQMSMTVDELSWAVPYVLTFALRKKLGVTSMLAKQYGVSPSNSTKDLILFYSRPIIQGLTESDKDTIHVFSQIMALIKKSAMNESTSATLKVALVEKLVETLGKDMDLTKIRLQTA